MQPEPVDFLKETGPPTQRIVLVRREYNTWVANESIEDYALRYTPRSFRKWSEIRVANTALGAVSFLALEAIGASIAVDFGFINALWAILLVSAFIFLTSIPICIYAARYSVDKAIVMPASTDLYFPPADNEFEVSHMPNAKLRIVETIWGHFAGGPGTSPVDIKVLDDSLKELLAS